MCESGVYFEEMLTLELAPHPTSMFDEYGLLRTSKQKSKLMSALKVEISARTCVSNPTAIFLEGTVNNYLNSLRNYALGKN